MAASRDDRRRTVCATADQDRTRRSVSNRSARRDEVCYRTECTFKGREVFLVARHELTERVRVTQAAEVFERVGRGDAAELRRDMRRAARARGLSSGRRETRRRRRSDRRSAAARRRPRRPAAVTSQDRRAVLAPRDDQRLRLRRGSSARPGRSSAQQLELVVVADDDRARRRGRRAARRPTCARTAGPDRR